MTLPLSSLRRLHSGSFVKDAAVLSLGAVIAQALNVVATPILARLYSPFDFGQFSVFLAVLSVGATIITLRYETMILLPKGWKMSGALIQLSLLLAVCCGVFLGVFAWLMPTASRRWMGVAELGDWFPAALVLGIFGATYATVFNALSRRREFAMLAGFRVMQSAMAAALGILMGVVGVASGLLWAQSIAMSVIGITVLFSLPNIKPFSIRRMKAAARRYADTPKFLLPAALFDVVTLQMPVVLIAGWFGGESAGQFGMAWRLMALPMSFVGAAIGQVFFQRFSSSWPNVQDSKHLISKTWKTLFAIGIVPSLIVMGFGRELFSWVLGPNWYEAGEVAVVIAPMLLGMLVSSPTSAALLVLGLQRYSLIFGVAFIFYRSACLYIGYRSNNLLAGLQLWVFCEVVAIFVFNRIIFSKMSSNEI